MLRYRILISIFAVLLVLRHGFSRFRTPGHRKGPHVWLHGASNGELSSVRGLMAQLVASRPDLSWIVTSNTATARDMVRDWNLPRVTAALAPPDLQWLTRRFIHDSNVVAHVTLESEFWPHRVIDCPGPVLVLGARMSEGTSRAWFRLGGLPGKVFGTLSLASAQDEASARRLDALGLRPEARGPVVDLKAFYDAPDVVPPAELSRAATWLAASTHEGEEEIVLDAHVAARQAEPELRLILAPRHPRRAAAIRALIQSRGLSVSQRSLGEAPGQGDVYLADTMGEMPLWYSACGRVFVAGTLTDRGGHTPYEPAAFGAALLHGPDTRNFRAAYAVLQDHSAALAVSDAATLAKALNSLADPAAQSQAGDRARRALQPKASLDALCDAVLRVLPPA